MREIDASGLSCPEPVIMVKKAFSRSREESCIIVDNIASYENVKRYLEAIGIEHDDEKKEGTWHLRTRG